jgi:MiaB-like tRNA modifying enzyme
MTFLIDFLGCKVNSYEVECIANDLIKHGYSLFDGKGKPDIIIINTCSVTATSGAKSRKMLRHYRLLFRKAIIIVMGCDAQKDFEEYSSVLKADIVLGTTERSHIIDYIEEFLLYHEPILIHDDLTKRTKYEEINVTHFLSNTRAYVKIQDGCDNYCTYCLIPYVRGHSRSRDENEILNEIKILIEKGYKEIVLTGIDMCSYGADFAVKKTFSDLLEDILVQNPALYRLRISSIEESQIDNHFLELLDKYKNIANHLHIPLQSGSVSVLERMHRKYNLENYRQKIKKIRLLRPDIAISTDVIVGFPGETYENFIETYSFCKEMNFSKIHVFPFSDREGTVAFNMTPKVSPAEKKDRVEKLISLSNQMSEKYDNIFANKKIEFLFENYDSKRKAYRGHSSNFLETYYSSTENLTGQVKKVEYVSVFDNVKNNLFDNIDD